MRLPADKEKIIIDRYRAGDPVLDICRDLGVSKTLLYRVLRRNGFDDKRQTTTVLSEVQRRAVVEKYLAGGDAAAIAKAFDVSRATVYNIVHESGASVLQPNKWLSDDEEQLVAEVCLSGGTSAAVAAQFGVSQETVLRVLKDHGVRLPKGRPRSCEVNDAAFDVLTPESAYWIGFLFSDGCVHRDKLGQATLVCGLGEKDLGHLEKLRAFCGSTHAIYHQRQRARVDGKISVPDRTIVYWRVRSDQICRALESYGIVTKRTRVPVPELAASRDFWRGCVDGDGCVGSTKIGRYTYVDFKLYGQKLLMECFLGFLRTHNLASMHITPTESGIWSTKTTGITALNIVDLLYRDAAVALERKRIRAQQIIDGDVVQFPSYENPARTKNVI